MQRKTSERLCDDALEELLLWRSDEMSDELRARARSLSSTLNTAATVATLAVLGLAAAAIFLGNLQWWVALLLWGSLPVVGGFIADRSVQLVKERIASRIAVGIEEQMQRHLIESVGSGGDPVGISLRDGKRSTTLGSSGGSA